MWERIFPHVILLISANIFKASCEGTSSLTFVIDDTNSMTDDIDQVKSSADKIMNIVFNEKSSVIKNMVLVTFNDPDSHVRTVTKRRDTFKSALNAVHVDNNYAQDCPEMSMQGLLRALETSLPGSYIYVFTDASAKDYYKSEAVKEMCQRKQSQIVFVLTGYCYNTKEAGFRVYYDIAAACSGIAFHVKKNEVNQVVRTIEETIKGNKTVVTTVTVPARVPSNIPFTLDDQTEYAIVSASGSDVKLTISGPPAVIETIMWNTNGKVLKLVNPPPGGYVATVMGETATSVVVVGRTDFFFSHGFSELEPKTKGDTAPQPIADAKVHLSISVSDPKHSVRIISAQIMQMNENVIQELPLKETSKDFYITRPFVAPSYMFKVAVVGIVKSTKKPIRRIARIPVTPQKPPKKLPNKTKPTASIVEGESIQVEYDSKVKLTCKVTAYPDPKIKWLSSRGVTMKSSSSVVQYPYEFISYLVIPNAMQRDKFICYAENNQGTDLKHIEVHVNDALVAKSVPTETTKVFYGSEGTITCDIRSTVPMHIRWYYVDEITAANRQIVSSDKYSISADGTQLKIKKMDLDLVGKYICKASLIRDENVQKAYSTRVQIDGLAIPKVTGAVDTKVVRGRNAVLECKIVKGLPMPKIAWQYMDNSGSKFVPITGSDNVLRIPNVEQKHAGDYKCVAENVAGSDEHVTTLIIQEYPKITSSVSTVYQSVEGDALLKIPCVATGRPKPVITWKLNGGVIKQNAKYSIEDGALIIRAPKVSDTNSYTCEAKNDVASVTAIFKTYIFQIPKLSGVAEKKVRIGSPASIDCTVVKGEPKPYITWQFMDKSTSIFTPIAGSENVLRISSADSKHAGRYKCVAQNTKGSDEHITTLTVESPARIVTKSSSVYEGLEGDDALRIPCEVVGVPKPAITWKFKGAVLKSNDKYSIEDEALVIMKPNIKDSGTSYTCEAKNYIGSDSATFNAVVEQYINGFGNIHHVYLREGETKKLECAAYNGSESQSVRWFIEEVEMHMGTPYMTIENATMDNDGNYTCRVTDKHGHTETHTYVVDVGHPPYLVEQTPLNDWRGEIDHIFSNCRSDAKPEADVEWKFNGKMITEENIIDPRNSYKWGHYSCNVSNVHGSVQRSFDVKSTACLISKNLEEEPKMPLLLTDEKTWPRWTFTKQYLIIDQKERITLSCPNSKEAPNAFQKFPKQSELKAYCDKQDTFLVDGKFYKLSDLHCGDGISPSIIRKKVKCSSETSELIRVGYDVSGFLETYEVCFDHAYNMPLYSRVLMTETAGSPSIHHWYKYPGIGDSKGDRGLTCRDSSSSCCYGKTQLVDVGDFSYSPAKKSTFIDPLNAIPYWRPCDKREETSWNDIADMVRIQLKNYGQFVGWSGIHTLEEKDGAVIPRYLWKVLRFDDDESVAIVHVNAPSPTGKDIKCDTEACKIAEGYWFTPSGNSTYCCKLPDFLEAFGLRGTNVGESLDAAYGKIKSMT